MQLKIGDIIGLFGETESHELLDVWEGEFGLLDDGRNIKFSDVFICCSYNGDTITKTYWDQIVIVENVNGPYLDRDDYRKEGAA
jgi:hypothetical protein